MLVEHGHDVSGTTAQRPTNAEVGQRYYDTTLGVHLVYTGTVWAADGSFYPRAAQQALTGSGAVNITSYYTTLNSTGGGAYTLANGVRNQLKKVQLIVDGGDATLTPANLAGGATITFADVGDYALLIFDGTDWVALELGNDADGATAPVLA